MRFGRVCLVYDHNRRHIVEQPLPEDIRKALKGDPKGYFQSRVAGMEWGISERVANENW